MDFAKSLISAHLLGREMSNVPKLRFKEFSGEWEEKKLGEIGDFKSGTGFPENEQGGECGIPFFKVSDMNLLENTFYMKSANHYVTGEQISKLKFKVIKEASIIFAKVGAAIFLERKRIAENFLIDNNMMAFTPKANLLFMKYIFDTIKLSKYSQVGALPSYNASDLKIIKVKIPFSIYEQTKIASFLTSVDTKIKQLTKKDELLQEYKKGVMQKLFNQELRFKDDNGKEFPEWENTSIENHFDVASSKRVLQKDWTDVGIPFYRTRELVSLAKNEPFSSEIFISSGLFNELANKYGIPKSGDFLVSGVGTLGVYYQVKDKDRFYFKDGNVLWLKIKPTINSNFFKYCFESDFVQSQIIAQASTTTVGTYTIQNAKKTKLFAPKNLKEQIKIANFLSSIDKKIEWVQTELEKTKEFKKGLLQQMFV